jgi:hypothetical protein
MAVIECLALAGVLLVLGAPRLAARYCDWTARLRARHPNFNPAPPKRQTNTRICTILLCLVGMWFLAGAVYLLLAVHSA